MLFLLAAALQLMRYLPGGNEAQLPAEPKFTAGEPREPQIDNTARLFKPLRRTDIPVLLPPLTATAPTPQSSDISVPMSRFYPVKQRGNRAQTGSRFVKISFEGNALPAEERYWSCARDLDSGLLWEVKLSDAGISDAEHTYSWYQPDHDPQGKPDGGTCFGIRCDTEAYVQEINRLALCGSHN